MTGKQVVEVLKRHNKSIASVATAMETSRQNLNSKLRGTDIGFGMIREIAKASNIPISEFTKEDQGGYTVEPNTPYMEPSQQLAHAQQIIIELHVKLEKSLQKTIDLQDKVIASQDETIEVLKQWNEFKGKMNRK